MVTNNSNTSNAMTANNRDKECAICLENVNFLQKTLPCGHRFHQRCINIALEHQLRCPTCLQSPYEAKNLKKIDMSSASQEKVYLPISMAVTTVDGSIKRKVLEIK